MNETETPIAEAAGVESATVPFEGELEVKDVEPWERFRNGNTRREQKFLQSTPTHEGAVVEMSRGTYTVTRQGWRKNRP